MRIISVTGLFSCTFLLGHLVLLSKQHNCVNAFVVEPSRLYSGTRSRSETAPLAVATPPSVAEDAVEASYSGVSFPPALSPVDRIKRAATFWSTALPIVADYYGLISQIKLQEILKAGDGDLTEERIEEMWAAKHKEGAAKLADTITQLKGFYCKTAQIIASRHDLFPKEYTDALSGFTDYLDPMPASLAKAVVQKELLHADEKFEDVFVEFDDEPLGAASVAQVHRAVLTEKYGSKVVAVKIQRPSIESKLMGDVANLKAITRTFRDFPALPLDYYTVFCELEKQLADEFDFVAEAVAMDRIYTSLARAPDGTPRKLPLVIPRPIPGLVSRRVLVMDYLDGVPLSRAREEMNKKGIDPDSPESKLFARRLLSALTESFGKNILETGFFHADPHAGNIFVLKDGRIGLIDFGQVKQISGRNRETLCRVMIALDERKDENPVDMNLVGKLSLELGVKLKEGAKPEAAPAIGVWLFDGGAEKLPGGYDTGELSPNSPVKELQSFPQDLVLVGRSSILIKGLSNRLNIPWSLAKEWAPIARQVLHVNPSKKPGAVAAADDSQRVRFRVVLNSFKEWGKGRAEMLAHVLPSPIRSRVASLVLKIQEARTRRKLTKRAS